MIHPIIILSCDDCARKDNGLGPEILLEFVSWSGGGWNYMCPKCKYIIHIDFKMRLK
jgi:hypothetical protein